MEIEDGGSAAVALEDDSGAAALVALGGGLRLQQRCWVAAAAEEHATMASASLLSKPRALYYDIGISSGKHGKKEHARCKGCPLAAIATRQA
jgi:hypothetical protein